MLKQQASVLKKANIILDAALVVASFMLAFNIRFHFSGLKDLDNYTWLLLVVIPIWLILLDRYGFYQSQRFTTILSLVKSLGMATVAGGVVTASIIFAVARHDFSRGFLGAFLIISFLLLTGEQLLIRWGLHLLRSKGYNFRNVLLVGTGECAARILELLSNNGGWGFKVVGLLENRQPCPAGHLYGYPVIGDLSQLTEVCKANAVDEVLFCDPMDEAALELSEYIASLDEMGITSRTVLNLYFRFQGEKEINMLHDEIPLLTLRPVKVDANQLFYKRCLDIVGACVGLAFSACLFPFIALAIKLESRGPLFFGQTRVRENGRTFTCWKFRSMYRDAEARKQELMHLNEMEGAIFKIKDDPRVTMVGAFLRKTSLDELPQFWNVLKGEMSLVGTRPPTPAEVDQYHNWQRKRICMKPGITGLWQVSGRNSVKDFDEVVRLDLEYINSWSLGTDIRLLLRTIKVVFFREGAC